MDLSQSFAISASGLDAEKTRLHIISNNLANVESTRTTEGGPYRRRDVIFRATPTTRGSFEEALVSNIKNTYLGVQVEKIVVDERPFKLVFQPQHPDANADGYVEYPNVNALEEMVNMMSALRSYEANVTALNATKNMALKTLEIGR